VTLSVEFLEDEEIIGSVQTLSHIWFGLSGARQWLTQ
jgi:hypothetical protein